MAALFIAVAVVATAAIERSTVTNNLEHEQIQGRKLAKIAAALSQYASAQGRLPCPAQYSISASDQDMAGEYGDEISHYLAGGTCAYSGGGVDPLAGWPGIDVLNMEAQVAK